MANKKMSKSIFTVLNKHRVPSMMFMNARFFSHYYRKITPEILSRLHHYENHYEADPTNQKVGF